MAVIRTTAIVSDVRGSLGDVTYSRNQGGAYVRARAGPGGEPTQAQTACQAVMTVLSKYWSGTLTQQQRDDWHAYAQQHPQSNQWGIPILRNGYTRFIQANWHWTREDYPTVVYDDAPPNPPMHPPVYVLTAVDTNNLLYITIPPLNYDPPQQWMRFYLYAGDGVSPGTNFYAGPWLYRIKQFWWGYWYSDPWLVTSKGTITAGQRLYTRMIAQDNYTGAISTYGYANAIVQ